MSNAALDPTATCVVVEKVFTPAELDTIERYGDSLQQQEALLGSGSVAGSGRSRSGKGTAASSDRV